MIWSRALVDDRDRPGTQARPGPGALLGLWVRCGSDLVRHPMVFIVAGVKMAPRFWFYVACILIASKAQSRRLISLPCCSISGMVARGLRRRSLLMPRSGGRCSCQILFLAFAALTISKDRNISKEPTAPNAGLDFQCRPNNSESESTTEISGAAKSHG